MSWAARTNRQTIDQRCREAFDERHCPLSFGDLARATGARYSDVVDWVSRARAAGVIVDAEFTRDRAGNPVGARTYELSRG